VGQDHRLSVPGVAAGTAVRDAGLEWGPARKGAGDLARFTPAPAGRVLSAPRSDHPHLDRLGFTTSAAARTATMATRPAKEPAAELAELRAGRAERAAILDLADVNDLLGRATPRQADVAELFARLISVEGLTRSRSSFDRRDVLQALAA
jgi:hypothetical protein